MSKKFYLITNWEAGYRTGVTVTGNGLETETTDQAIAPSAAITTTNANITIKPDGYKYSISNNTASPQTTTLRGVYDSLDFNVVYKVVVSKVASIDEGTPPSTSTGLPSNLVYEASGLQGRFEFLTAPNEIVLTVPANTTWYLFATNGTYMPLDRFYRKAVASNANPSYITELFKYNKLEDITKFFLPLVEGKDLKDPTKTASLEAFVAVSSVSTYDFTQAGTTWYPINQAPGLVTRSNPYFRFKITIPSKPVAISKIGYAIETNMGFTEPIQLQTTIADVEYTVYRPALQVKIANRDVTKYVDNVQSGNITLHYRKVEETRRRFYLQDITIILDGVVVSSGKITSVSKKEYPNAVSYDIQFTTYRELLGSTYADNGFAFNAAPQDVTSVPFSTEYEFINSIVAYSPASNGIILNSEKFKDMRSTKFWTDEFDIINQTGGMGMASTPDKWTHFYLSNQKLSLETINQVANANRLVGEVTHTGNLILSDLIPHDECTLNFDISKYQLDQTSLLSKCTHRYHDLTILETDGSYKHLYVPDHRLYVPEVNYNIMQAGSIVRVNGTSGVNQATYAAIEQDIGVYKGFDTGNPEYSEVGSPFMYKFDLTTRQPNDFVRFTFYVNNKDTGAKEQTVLKGSPKMIGLEKLTYVTDGGTLFKPSTQPGPAAIKVNAKWVSGTLEYLPGEFDDAYGVKQLELEFGTDDLRDEPARQGFLGAIFGFIVGVAVVAIAAIAIAFTAGAAAVPLIAGITVGSVVANGALVIGGATVVGLTLGTLNGTFVAKISVQAPINIKGIPVLSAHQDYTEAPLIGLPEAKWFPKWAKTAYQEALEAKDMLGIEATTVDNPYVVSLDAYGQPEDTTDPKYADKVKYSMYHKDLHNIVATGLTLREWLKARSVKLQYVGNPNWYPHQFIAIAKPPVTGNTVTEYEYFYTLGPQTTNIQVGGEVSTEIEAAYIGSSNGNVDLRYLELLSNKLTSN